MKSSSRLHVAPATAEAARFACENWHYSRSLPVGRLVRFGVWEDERFVGVIIYSRGGNRNAGKFFGVSMTEICELTRVAFRSHTVPVSQALAVSLRLLRRAQPGLRVVLSYADTAKGHTGGIYKASNWLFFGRTAPLYDFRDAAGRIWRNRNASKSGVTPTFGGGVVACPKRGDCQRIPIPSKLRFAFFFDEALRAKLQPKALPYEGGSVDSQKRGGGLESEAPAHQAGEGDAMRPRRSKEQ